MRHKPWPILILALIHVLMPALNMTLAARGSGLNLLQYLALYWKTENLFHFASQLLLLPIAGFAIFSFKRWSYPVYLAAILLASYNSVWSFHSLPHFSNLNALLLPVIANLILAGYFLVPSVRELYFNKSLRWWESQERFPVSVPCQIRGSSKECVTAEIQNLSKGGCFVVTPEKFPPDEDFQISFSAEGANFELLAKVVHLSAVKSHPQGFGFQFLLSKPERKNLALALKSLRHRGITPLNRVPLTGSEFLKWAKRLVTTGRGLFPERD